MIALHVLCVVGGKHQQRQRVEDSLGLLDLLNYVFALLVKNTNNGRGLKLLLRVLYLFNLVFALLVENTNDGRTPTTAGENINNGREKHQQKQGTWSELSVPCDGSTSLRCWWKTPQRQRVEASFVSAPLT